MKKILFVLMLITASPAFAAGVYDRVMDSGTIRCGYIPYPPAMIVDPNTGEKSGIFYDVMNEIGKRLSLKVEWVQESGWGTFINDLKSDRFDLMCSAIWTNSARAREADHTEPLYYSAITGWVKAGDSRFDSGLKMLNDPQYSIATIDGETAATIAKTDFPQATLVSLPELSAVSDMALSVSTGKADITFLENYIAQGFLKTNPGTIKQAGEVLRLYGNAIYMKKGEHDLRLMIDDVIGEILNSGFLPELFEKYEVPEHSYLIPAKPYETAP
ncbi:MAG: ABC transporter substrate-binding protein [Alphaproteobacteria bacterium]|nr:ABC transporter substrate-binding protein [Alphaproteobacteria bacterium]